MKLSTRQIIGISASVVVAIAIAHYDEVLPYHWRTFTAPDGSFSAQFPANPDVEDRPVELATGGTTVTHQIVASPLNTTSYSCVYFEDPRLTSQPPEAVLDSARDGGISKVQGNLVSEKRLEIDGYPARDVEARVRGNSLLEMRLIAAQSRLFVLMVVDTSRQTPDSKNVQRFFDSLKFSGKN